MSASLRVLEKTDSIPLARFLAEQTRGEYDESFWLDRFDVFWERNPSRTDDMPRGWLLADGEAILGFIGNIPTRYAVDGVETIFFSATSWYVSEEARQRSLELLVPFLKQKTGLLDTTPTPAVAKILVGAGFERVERPWTGHELLLPLNPALFSELVVSKLGDRSVARGLARPAARLALAAQAALHAGKRMLSPPDGGPQRWLEIFEFGPEYDDLWARVKGRHRVCAVRGAEQLNWLIFGSPQMRKTRRVIEVRRGETLAGYAAVKRAPVNPHRHEDGLFLELIDLILDDEAGEAFDSVVDGLLSLADSEDSEADRLAFMKLFALHPTFESSCRRAGFLRRRLESRYFVRGFSGTHLFASPLDGDRCFHP